MNKHKLKDLAYLKLPQFVKADYPKFVSFIKAYYEFLDNRALTRNLEYIRDVDRTLPQFVDSIKSEIAQIAPSLADNPLFLKHSKEIYTSRGSLESYNLLFRLLYNKDVDISAPGNKILKASDGRWIQENSFYVKCVYGDVNVLENTYVFVSTKVKNVVQKLKVYVTKVTPTNDNGVYELFFDRSYYGTIQVGDSIETDDLLCVVLPTVTKVSIKQQGFGFKIGEIFTIDTNVGSGLQIKVVKVGENGELLRVQILSHGLGYIKPFNYNIIQEDYAKPYLNITGHDIQAGELINSINDFGFVSQNDYSTFDYMSGDYGGDVKSTFYNLNFSSLSEQIIATLKCEVGAINIYPGYYNSSIGLLSDDSYIQDGNYYQDFSYIIKIDEMLSAYETIVKTFVHPSGHKLFAEYLIETDIELFYDISNPIIRILLPLYSETNESTTAHDSVVSGAYVYKKNITAYSDSISINFSNQLSTLVVGVLINDILITPEYYTIDGNTLTLNAAVNNGDIVKIKYATLTYSIGNSQSIFFDLVKGSFSDVINNADKWALHVSMKKFDDLHSLFDSSHFDATLNKNDSVALIDVYIKATLKCLFDDVISIDSLKKYLKKPLFDAQNLSDSNALLVKKPFSDVVGKTDYTTKMILKSLSESKTASDVFVAKLFKPLLENIVLTEAFVKSNKKTLSDVLMGFTETMTIMPSRKMFDTINTPTDSISRKDFDKSANDSISSYTESKIFIFGKRMNEVCSLAENFMKRYTRTNSDVVYAPTDSQSKNTRKAFTDITPNSTDTIQFINKIKRLTENVVYAETINRVVRKPISDASSPIENVKLTPRKKTSDSANTPTDTGVTTWHRGYGIPSEGYTSEVYDNDNIYYNF